MPTRIETIPNLQSRYIAGVTLALFSRNCNAGDASDASDASDAGASTSTSLSLTLLSCPPVSTPTASKSELRKSDKS
jgi:hypothetical protein